MVSKTAYDKNKMKTRIVHIGFGAFHRGHQALYNDLTNDILHRNDDELWGIGEISMFSKSDIFDYMDKHSNNFTVIETDTEKKETRIVRTVSETVCIPKDGMNKALDMLCASTVSVVTLTITEKGYCTNMQTRCLDFNNNLIQHDLKNIEQPKTAIGLITLGIKRRRELGLPPFTVLSCDNISENGVLLQNAIISFAKKFDDELGLYIEKELAFPSCMVDRIVPAITEQSLDLIESEVSERDVAGVVCEEFRQWVIEDKFISERPHWDLAGAEFTYDVAIYEEMKLRMLNGSHTFLACMGQLMGIQYISEAIKHEKLRSCVKKLMLEEQAVSLSPDLKINLKEYSEQLLYRFSNESLQHMTSQIVQDSSQKIVQRAIEPMLVLYKRGVSIKYIPAMVASWMQYVINTNEFIDPLESKIKFVTSSTTDPKEKFYQLLSLEEVFPQSLVEKTTLVDSILTMYMKLEHGGPEMLINYLEGEK